MLLYRSKRAFGAAIGLLAAVAGLGTGFAGVARAQVVVSQVSGNGGLTGDTFDRDFIELFNKGSAPVSLTGWSLQVWSDLGSSSTPATPNWTGIPLSGVIRPGQYLLVVPTTLRGSLGASVSLPPLPPGDILATDPNAINLGTSANAVALLSSTAGLAAGECPLGRADLVDLFRFGLSNGTCFEGAAIAVGPTTGARTAARNDAGCADSNFSAADLVTGLSSVPRNGAVNAFAPATFSPAIAENTAPTPVTLSVAVGSSAPCNPLPSLLTAATANLSALGGPAAAPMSTSGGGLFSIATSVPAGQAPGTYDIPVTVASGATSIEVSARLVVFPAPAASDACIAATVLTGSSTLFSGRLNTLQATSDTDAGTCNADDQTRFSVWFSYTPAVTGALRVDEFSSEDIVVSVHPSCGATSSACLRNDRGSGIPLAAGVQVFIQVGQETGSTVAPQVPLDLTLAFEPSPANAEPCGAVSIPLTGSLVAAPNAAALPATVAGVNVTCDQGTNPPEARRGAWYTITTGAQTGAIEFSERSSNFAVMTVLTAPSCAGPFSEIAAGCVSESASLPVVAVQANTTYYVLVSLSSFSVVPSLPYDLTLRFIPAPPNDTCPGATNLNAVTFPYSESVPARAATVDAGVPTSTGTGAFNACSTTLGNRPAGVWYVYTSGPAESGNLRVQEGSTNDVFYNVFNVCGGAASQCYGSFSADDIYIRINPSQTYYILVGLQSSSATPTVDYALTFTRVPFPSNDTACNATLVTGPAFADSVNGPGATADIDVSCNYTIPAQSTTGYGVWYRFQPATAQVLRVQNTVGDVLVYGLFTGPDCSNLSESLCRMGNNGALTTDNTAYFNLQAGQAYWLLTGKISNGQPFGAYALSFGLTDAPGACCTGTSCAIATAATCAGSFRGAFTACGDQPQFVDAPSAPIPDATSGAGGTPGVLTRTINASGPGTVQDLKLLVELSHARVGDLIVTLASPSGQSVELLRRIDDDDDANCPNFNSQGRLTDLGATYIFDDQAYTPEGPGFAAAAKYFDFTGLVVPAGRYRTSICDLSSPSINGALAGSPIAGTWTLTISDNQSSSIGTLARWGLIINGGSTPPCACRADFNNSGTRDVADIFAFLSAWFANAPGSDFDNSGTRDVADIFAFLSAWFAGC